MLMLFLKRMALQFYTNIAAGSDCLLLREVVDGRRIKRKVPYQPTLFIPSNKKTKWRGTDETVVEPIKFESVAAAREYVRQLEDVSGAKIYGNTDYRYAYLNEEYPTEPVEFNSSQILVFNIDIEVDTTDGFCEAQEAVNQITAITIRNSLDRRFYVWGMGEFRTDRKDISYFQCKNEEDMLYRFLDYWESNTPDLVIGWNIENFDIPYLVNRITRVRGKEEARRLSPWKIVREKTRHKFGKDVFVYDIGGMAILDYMVIYRKNVLEPRESFSLNAIANVELGESKISYDEVANLNQLHAQNHQKFIEYNIHDVELVERLDRKLKLVELQLVVAYATKINYDDVFSQVKTWDTLICNHLFRSNIVIPMKEHGDSKHEQYAGAYVKEPIVGLHSWVTSFDVTSLYPNIMRTLNMGIETKMTADKLPSDLRAFLDTLRPREDRTSLVKRMLNGDVNMSPIYDANLALSANGVTYKREPQSFYSQMIDNLFNQRVLFKKKAQKGKKEVEAIHTEMKNRPDPHGCHGSLYDHVQFIKSPEFEKEKRLTSEAAEDQRTPPKAR